uniref:Allergenic protein Tha p 2 n=1 Tax=Thaumetopoea processionea TaxID=499230 RepID=A0A0K2W8M0_9NEOP|nr:Allergenic protein Tha p 2 [Thaumetopoea processionea]
MKLLIFATLIALSSSLPQLSEKAEKAIDLTYQEKNNLFELGSVVGDILSDKGCHFSFGCHKGYCWAGCGNPRNPWSWGDHWCYTTKTYSQSYSYVECTQDSECNGCWSCGGPCSA